MFPGGTMKGQHERTVDMLEDMMKKERPVAEVLWFLYDCQTTNEQLKALAEIAQRRKV